MSENEKVYIRNQRIYKKYAGQFEELKKLELWMVNYHKLITKIVTKGKIDEIKTLAKEIRLEFHYKDYQSWNINITELDEILIDFLQQFSIMCGNEYYDFSIMENDKLVLYNIVEKYINTLKGCSYKSKHLKKFVKITKSSLDLVIPKSKDARIFDSFMQRYLRASIHIVLISVIAFILVVLTIDPFIGLLNSFFDLPIMINVKCFIIKFIPMNVFSNILQTIVIIFLSIAAFFLTIFILIISRKFWYPKLPEIEFAFERDIFEKKSYFANLSFIVSLLALVFSIIFNLF